MQTLLKRAAIPALVAASLLWTPPTFAANRTKAQKNTVHKNKFIATASRNKITYHHASHVRLVWCDLHVCEEKPQVLGVASYYGKHYWQGRKMANGERFDYRKKTMACWWLPLNSQARVTNLDNGRSVVLTVTDRGPAHMLHRVADLSQAAAEELGYAEAGLARVIVQPVVWVEQESAEIGALITEPEEVVALFPEARENP
jgi:rare lipoprotein A